MLVAVVLIFVLRGIYKRRGDYQFFYETEVSKLQLAKYDKHAEMQKEKKVLKKKINEAKSKGESFVEFQKEFEEKFSKNARQEEIVLTEEKTDDSYSDILGENVEEIIDVEEKDNE